MLLITPPLQKNSQGPDVKNLHHILFFINQKLDDPGINKFFNETGFQSAYKTEVFQQLYGTATLKFVSFLQEFFQLQQFEMGVVDKPTAQKFNKMVSEFNGLEMDKPEGYPFEVSDENQFKITGKVTDIEKNGLSKITVIISEYDIDKIINISAATTDEKGNFSVSFTYTNDLKESDNQTNPDIIFQLVDQLQNELEISSIFINNLDSESPVGKISDANLAPIVLMNVPKEIILRIVHDSKQKPFTEFERMILLLDPYMHQINFADLKEDENNYQVSFLSKESGVDKAIIIILKNAFTTERNTQLPAWAFFGLDRLPFDYTNSKNVAVDEMVAILTPLQPAFANEDLKILAQRILAYAREKTYSEIAESLKVSVGEILNPILEAPEKLGKLLDAYARFEGDDMVKFWDQVSEDSTLKDIIPKVQYSLQLAQLTFNNVALMNGLHSKYTSAKDLVQVEPEEWLQIIMEHPDTIPAHIEGENTDAKAKIYADGMQKYLEVSFPTDYMLKSLAKEPAIDLPVLNRLASLNPGIDIVNNLPESINFDGLSEDQKKESQQALINLQQEIAAYPAYGEMLTKNKVLTGKNIKQFPNTVRRDVSTFLTNNQEFNISHTPFDQYIKDKADSVWTGIENKQVIADQVRRMQRIHTVTASTTDMDILLGAGMHSAFEISRIPLEQFVQGMSTTLSAKTAALYHQKANKITSNTTFLYRQLYEAGAGGKPRLGFLNNGNDDDGVPDAAESIKLIPNWEELFGSLDTCQCRDCLSVYSPAAYFVDLLNIKNGFTKKENVYNRLFERRPDLKHIRLSCENTNTLIPYIDLVNEILETYIANGALKKETTIDTSAFTAAELAANAQHPDFPAITPGTSNPAKVFEDAYNILKNANYPAGLPFDLPLVTARKFLNEQGSSRYEVMKTFQKDEKLETLMSIEAEQLEMSTREFEVITGSHFDTSTSNFVKSEYEYYGYAKADIMPVLSAGSKGNAVEILQKKLNLQVTTVPKLMVNGKFDANTENALKKFQRNLSIPETGKTDKKIWSFLFTEDNFAGEYLAYVNEFLDRTGIIYTDLIALLNTQILNSDKSIILALHVPDGITDIPTWESAHACDLEYTRLLHNDGKVLTNKELSLFARFIRLWKKISVSVNELDIIIIGINFSAGLNSKDINHEVLWQLPKIIGMSTDLNVPFEKLMAFWSNINTWGEKSLFETMFLNNAALQIDDIFLLDPSRKQLLNTSELINDHIPALLAAFKIKKADLDLIFEIAKINSSNDKLTIEVISNIYRHVLLAKAVKLSVKDFVKVLQLSAVSPWGNVFSVLSFIELADKCKQSGLNIPQLAYIYLHETDAKNSYLPSQDDVLRIAQNIRQGLLKIIDDTSIKDEVVNEEFLKVHLGVLFNEQQAGDILVTLKDSKIFETVLPAPLINNFDAFIIPLNTSANKYLIPRFRYDGTKTKEKLIFQGAMTDNEKTELQKLSADPKYKKAIDDLWKQPRTTLEYLLSGFLSAVFVTNLINTSVSELDKFKELYIQLFPFIKDTLSDTLIKQQLSNTLKTDANLIDALIEISKTFWGDKLRSDIVSLSLTGLSGTYFDSANKIQIERVDEQINKNWGTNSEDKTKIATDNFKVIWTGKIEVPKTEVYTFTVKKDADSDIDLKINGQTLKWAITKADEWTSESIPLKTGALLDINLSYTEAKNDAMIALSWSSKTIPTTLIPTVNLYPSKPLEDFYSLFILLQKITTITNAIKLKKDEIIYFSNNKTDFSGFDLSLFPTAKPTPYLPDGFKQFLRLVDYKTLRDSLPVGTNFLTDVFNSANRVFLFGDSVKSTPPTADIDKQKKLLFEQLVEEIVSLTSWDKKELETLIGNDISPLAKTFALKGGYFEVEPGDFKNEVFLLRIWKCMELSNRLGVSVAKIAEWVSSPVDFAQVQDIKRTLRAKYEEIDWADVSKSVNDKLRVMQRDALVAYILTLPALKTANVKDTNGLFSYFLIDVEMDACMLTSRIKQAISSVQLFFQRCLMNLELNVLPAEINIREWKWMKNYRVWEANRRVFLYPENWIEPELRDNKTPFFKELESELLQNEVNNDNVEKVLMNYLEKLDDVAKLDICGMYEDEEAGEVHVFGRTLNMPSIYYYRKLNKKNNIWTAWEKVQLDIQGKEEGNDSGVHLIPVVWNRRLYLFWPVFSTEKAEAQTDQERRFNVNSKNYWEIKFAWSEYSQNKWMPKKITKEFLSSLSVTYDSLGKQKIDLDPNVPPRFNHYMLFTFFRYLPRQSEHFFKVEITNDELAINVYRKFDTKIIGKNFALINPINDHNEIVDVILELTKRSNSQYHSKSDFYGTFKFSGCHNKVEVFLVGKDFSLPAPQDTINFYQEFGSTNQIAEKLILKDISKAPVPVPLLGSSEGIFQLLKSNLTSAKGYYNFFYGDKTRNYYVTHQGYLQVENFGKIEKADFLVVEKAKKFTSSIALKQKPLISISSNPTGNGMVLNPALLETGRATINAMSTGLSPEHASPIEKAFLDYPSVGHNYNSKTKFVFQTHYHGYVCQFMKSLNKGGIDELLTLQNQLQDSLNFFNPNPFDVIYQPDKINVSSPHPFTQVEFKQDTAYGDYNWELFFHIPMLIANRLSKNQRFEEANRWYQFVFNPTTNIPVFPGNESSRYWNVIPFMQTPKETIQELMNKLHSTNSADRNELENAIEAWRENPFNPHLIARMRLIAYKKNTVMKYLDNLIAWGDQLFSRDTIESINEATQLYIMAAEILGRYPRKIPARGEVSPKSFEELKLTLDAFSNALVKMETMFPFFNLSSVNNFGSLPLTVSNSVPTLYFCIPDNDKLLGYWDLVADRLFKIRHCQNIEGVERQLALFEPRIDPALLVQAVANGIDINSVLSDINAPLPHYRFSFIIEKALQMCGYLTSIGTSYLSALEKQDAEELSMLKATQETTMLSFVKEIKQLQIQEAAKNREGLEKTKEVTQTKLDYYTGLVNTGLIPNENVQLDALKLAQETQDVASLIEYAAGIAHIVPNFESPEFIKFSFGGSNVGSGLNAISRYINYIGSNYTYIGTNASIMGGHLRRVDEWTFQQKMAGKELIQIDKQILASQIREDISIKELNNQEQLIENAQRTEEFLRNKYTNQELYGWMVGEIATCFFPYYQLVYAWAKAAERLYRFELGISSSNFITFGYWDSFRKGLMAGEKLQLALKQMEKAYCDHNERDYEITKHISLLQTNPLALLKLIETGSCIIELPEYLFDLDYPGQYMRKIKNVTISIPCVVGPYTSINCTLTLLKSKLRMKNILKAGAYAEQEDDDRFETRLSATNSIATSHAQNDTGMFELNFRDERLLPFEGAGVISRWEIKLPKENNQFDTDTISDLILQFKYTAKEGGKALADLAMKEIKTNPNFKNGTRLFSLKHEFPDEWYRFLNPEDPKGDQVLHLDLNPNRFPYLVSNNKFNITNITLFLDSQLAIIPDLSLASPGNTINQYKSSKLPAKYGSLFIGHPSADWGTEDPGTWKLSNPLKNVAKLDKTNCNDVIAIVSYKII